MDLSALPIAAAIAIAAVAVLVAKGGRKGAPSNQVPPFRPTTATIYSASDSYGGYFDAGALHRYTPDPVAMISAAGPVQCVSRAINGLKLTELLAGGPVTMNVPELGAPGAVVRPLREQLQDDPSTIVVIGAGMVDCLFTDITLAAHLANVREAVDLVRAAGKQPVLRGFQRFATNDLISPERQERLRLFDDGVRLAAAGWGVVYIDLQRVPFDPAADICGDGLHPTQAYHERIAQRMAQALADIANRFA